MLPRSERASNPSSPGADGTVAGERRGNDGANQCAESLMDGNALDSDGQPSPTHLQLDQALAIEVLQLPLEGAGTTHPRFAASESAWNHRQPETPWPRLHEFSAGVPRARRCRVSWSDTDQDLG